MAKDLSVLRVALRAAVWKGTRSPHLVGILGVIAWAIAAIEVALLDQYVEAGSSAWFSPYGLNATLAWTAVCLAITTFFVRSEGRATALAAMMALSVLASLSRIAISLGLFSTGWERPRLSLWTGDDNWIIIVLVDLVWWIGAMLAILRSIEPERQSGRLLRTAGLWLALLAANAVFPHWPAFRGLDFDRRSANFWEYVPALLYAGDGSEAGARARKIDTAQVELAQPGLMESATERLAASVKGKSGIYTIGIAGWSLQDVFTRELEGALGAVAKTLPIEGRVVRLVNHADTVENTPIATRQNLAAAVRAMARMMNKDEDILFLFITSHGSPLGVDLWLNDKVHTNLTPIDVASTLDREGIRNRLLIVSACYSGIFLKSLANDNTIILTAAAEDKTSFGCSNEREWTYFGDAFFNRSLRPGTNLEEAFADAKAMIAQWEARDGLSASNPQAHFGPALIRKLDQAYVARNRAGASPAQDARHVEGPARSH